MGEGGGYMGCTCSYVRVLRGLCGLGQLWSAGSESCSVEQGKQKAFDFLQVLKCWKQNTLCLAKCPDGCCVSIPVPTLSASSLGHAYKSLVRRDFGLLGMRSCI